MENQILFIISFLFFLLIFFLAPKNIISTIALKKIKIYLFCCSIISAVAFFYFFLERGSFHSLVVREDQKLIFILLGCLAALAAIALFHASNQNRPPFILVVWAFLLIFSSGFGLFYYDLPGMLSRTKEARLDVTGLAFVFAEPKSRAADQAVNFVVNPVSGREPPVSRYAQNTNYQVGVNGLYTLARKAREDSERIRAFCQLSAFKNSPSCNINGNILGSGLNDALQESDRYFAILEPLAACLSAYADRFPNGLPIQEELSEIAVSFANREWIYPGELDGRGVENLEGLTVSSGGKNGEKKNNQSRTSLSHTDQGKKNALSNYVNEDSEKYFEPIIGRLELQTVDVDGENKPCKDLLNDRSKIWTLMPDTTKNWGGLMKTPHRSLLEAYVMVAAGYPYDGAQHLLKEYQEKFNINQKNDVAAWIFSFRILSALEQIYDHIDERKLQYEILEKMGEFYDNFFDAVFELDEVNLPKLIDSCSNKGFSKSISQKTDKINEELKLFAVQSIWVRIAAENRRWQAAYDVNLLDQNRLINLEQSMRSVFRNAKKYDQCFNIWVNKLNNSNDKERIRSQLAEVRVISGVTAGLIKLQELAGIVEGRTRRKAAPGSTDKIQDEKLLCHARETFKEAHNEVVRLQKVDKHYNWLDREARRIRTLLEKIDQKGATCHA